VRTKRDYPSREKGRNLSEKTLGWGRETTLPSHKKDIFLASVKKSVKGEVRKKKNLSSPSFSPSTSEGEEKRGDIHQYLLINFQKDPTRVGGKKKRNVLKNPEKKGKL